MNAPPDANTEYSRGSGAFRRRILSESRAPSTPSEPHTEATSSAPTLLALGALLGALLIVVSQFTALYHVHSATSSAALKTVGTGGNHAWAPIPLALAAAALAYPVYRYRNRTALVAVVALGIATLLIALLSDLPPTHATGLVGSSTGGYVRATATPSAGLYMETLGAVLLLVSGGTGFLMLVGPPNWGARSADH
jgi:hypothetical protein